MVITSKSQKMSTHTNAWGYQTAAIIGEIRKYPTMKETQPKSDESYIALIYPRDNEYLPCPFQFCSHAVYPRIELCFFVQLWPWHASRPCQGAVTGWGEAGEQNHCVWIFRRTWTFVIAFLFSCFFLRTITKDSIVSCRLSSFHSMKSHCWAIWMWQLQMQTYQHSAICVRAKGKMQIGQTIGNYESNKHPLGNPFKDFAWSRSSKTWQFQQMCWQYFLFASVSK